MGKPKSKINDLFHSGTAGGILTHEGLQHIIGSDASLIG